MKKLRERRSGVGRRIKFLVPKLLGIRTELLLETQPVNGGGYMNEALEMCDV
jgi:hypothetical protein